MLIVREKADVWQRSETLQGRAAKLLLVGCEIGLHTQRLR
jgi:hypothetical protein